MRHAIYLAVDEDTIIKNVMNGCAFEMNSVITENYIGYTPVEREKYDPEQAKALLAEAGYPDGFELTMDAPNDRYMNDAQIAQAVAGYLEKVGIKVNLNLMPKANFFSYIKPKENNSMFLMTGWSDASGDGLSLLHDMFYTYNVEAGDGTVNRGHYSNAKVDEPVSYTHLDVYKRQVLLCLLQVPQALFDLAIINAEELIRSGGHVDLSLIHISISRHFPETDCPPDWTERCCAAAI